MTMTDIDGYRVVIEGREGSEGLEGPGYIILQLSDGEALKLRNFKTYAELAAFAELLRNEPDLQWDDAERIVQSRPARAGRGG